MPGTARRICGPPAVTASRLASPFSKSVPTSLSMLMNTPNALAMKLCVPVIVQVAFVPEPLGTRSNCVVLVVLNGRMNSRREGHAAAAGGCR